MADLSNVNTIIDNVGKGGLNALFPDDFEYYVFTLELTTFDGLKTLDFLTFPVMPRSIDYNEQSLVNIKKTVSGVSSLDNDSFKVKDISISGNFGKKSKILFRASTNLQDINQETFSIQKSSFKGPSIKTGYGTIKLLESILTKASNSDDGKGQPVKLFLYNQALGHSFLVKVQNFALRQQTPESNMIWNYNISFKAIAPADRVISIGNQNRSLATSTTIDSLQKNSNKLASNLKNFL